ncbi:MAG TPA: PaaX family transcriptional regulator C-terminal domain-containing protein [Arthrobacter sp.]|nr:PaaX family transcriptional regulator C-terminal domain-containing protein [Arthrobacter sp.]
MDSRPGSTTSLLRTVIGLYLRDAGGWMSTKHLVVLMAALDVAPAITRTALSRLKKKGVVVPQVRHGAAGFVITEGAAAMLARGDRRIFNPRSMSAGDRWCLVSFSIPEKEREKRHQLRRRLHWVGCGMVASGLWISPDFLRDEVEEILQDLGVRGKATMFTADTPQVGGSLREAAAAWWDLDAVAELHRDFIGRFASGQDPSAEASAETFATFVRCIDHWRTIPYLDPGLPPEFLPTDWPGAEGTNVFRRIVSISSQPSREFVRSVAANST